ncbi:MAG TPA: EAL domain-containing protein [Actinocatenispora sp.]
MESTALRNSAPLKHKRVFVAFVAVTVAAGAAVTVASLPGLVHAVPSLPVDCWLLILLAALADSRPFAPSRRNHLQSSVFPSVCFGFTVLLLCGLGPAVLLSAVSVAASSWRLRAAVWRAAFNAAQYVLAFGAAALVLDLAHANGSGLVFRSNGTTAIAVVLSAAAWFVVSHVLVNTAVRLRFGGGWWATITSTISYELFTTGALLLLAPVLAGAIRTSPWLIALILVPLFALYRSGRVAAEREREALHDPLTGLANRKGVQDRIEDDIAARGEGETRLGPLLLVLDLDRFKEVNDALGHGVGDRLLVEAGRRLRARLSEDVLVARLGGDEFAVVSSHVSDVEVAHAFAEKVAAVLAGPVHLDGMPLEVAGSIGAAAYPVHGADFDELLQHADVAMYEAKSRNDAVAVYAPEADHNSAARLSLLGDLRRTLERPDRPELGELGVFYQPQVDVDSGEVVGVEALLRWRHPEHGMVGPEEVIRAAEHTAVMRLLTYRVIDEVVGQVAAWRTDGVRLRAAINVSVRDLHTPDLVDYLSAQLTKHEVAPSQIELEITEGALMADPRRVLTTLRQLDRLGVALSLDDFGTGYSSMLHLRRLPLSEVKIDRSFVLGMGSDDDDAAIVRSIIELAGALGLRVVAEGVEDERTWRRLSALGCQVAQGWFYARPMPAAELTNWLARYRPPRVLRGALAQGAANA